MSQRKELLSITYHTDDDTGMYRVGEIDFGIRSLDLRDYIKHYGYQGVVDILANLGHLAYEVKKEYYEIKDKEPNTQAEENRSKCPESDFPAPNDVFEEDEQNEKKDTKI